MSQRHFERLPTRCRGAAGGAAVVALVAEEAGEIVGQVAFSPVTIDGRASAWHCLGPVAGRPDRESVGIGRRPIVSDLERLRGLGSAGCALLGESG